MMSVKANVFKDMMIAIGPLSSSFLRRTHTLSFHGVYSTVRENACLAGLLLDNTL